MARRIDKSTQMEGKQMFKEHCNFGANSILSINFEAAFQNNQIPVKRKYISGIVFHNILTSWETKL
jgi:hypothetical protein